jgi:hypothetical protein
MIIDDECSFDQSLIVVECILYMKRLVFMLVPASQELSALVPASLPRQYIMQHWAYFMSHLSRSG